MKRLLFSAALMCSIPMTGFAQDQLRGGGVTVPSVDGKSHWKDENPGDIILDTSDNNFYGYDYTGTWRNISAVSTPASGSSSGYVNTTTQTFGGDKTFADDVIVTGTLTPSGGIVGSTSGSSPSTGIVGEVLTATTSGSTSLGASTNTAKVQSLPLTAGSWIVYGSANWDFTTGDSTARVTAKMEVSSSDGVIVDNFSAIQEYLNAVNISSFRKQSGVFVVDVPSGGGTVYLNIKYTLNSGTMNVNPSAFDRRIIAIRKS